MFDSILGLFFKNNTIFKDYIDDNIHDNILTDDPSISEPKEYDSHITVLYGIKDKSCLDSIKKIISNTPQINVTLGEISIFDDNKEFDVIKIDVNSKQLMDLNKKLRDSIKYSNKYSEYKPHLTLAYVKKGKGDDFVGDRTFFGKKIIFKKIIFGTENGEKYSIAFKSNQTMDDSSQNPTEPEDKPKTPSKQNDVSTKPEQEPMKESKFYKALKKTIEEMSSFQLGSGGYGSAAGGATAPAGAFNTPQPQINYTRSSFPPVNVISYDYNTIDPEDLNVQGIDKDELFQGIQAEMERMEIPEKSKARLRAISNIRKDPHYYSGLHRYLNDDDGGIDQVNDKKDEKKLEKKKVDINELRSIIRNEFKELEED